jgi:hypothetical protein
MKRARPKTVGRQQNLAAPAQMPLVDEAKRLLAELAIGERRLLSERNYILGRAWLFGRVLSAIKDRVGRGNWYLWLNANLPELGSTERSRQDNAARCIRFFRGNPADPRNSGGSFEQSTVRKFMWGYVPKKERPLLPGNERVRPSLHHLTWVNQFCKWDRQAAIGKVSMPAPDVFRRDITPVVRRLVALLGRPYIQSLLDE